MARAADPDAWRSRVREALAQRDGKVLAELVGPDEVVHLLPSTLSAVVNALGRRGVTERAEALLREAQRQHPNDFWTNYDLAYFLQHSQPRQVEEAIRFLTASLVLRQQSLVAQMVS